MAAIHRTPFWILGATVRDDRRRIVALAEERSLHIDHDSCQKARTDLTNPRTRLSAEMQWMPGVAPAKAREAAEALLTDAESASEDDGRFSGLPALAKANLLASAFEGLDGDEPPEFVAQFILQLARVVDEIDPEEVRRDLNEDRAVSGFPPVQGLDGVEMELAERRACFRDAIRDALNKMPPQQLVDAMTRAARQATDDGATYPPLLFSEVVGIYEKEVHEFLAKQGTAISALIARARIAARMGEAAVSSVFDRIAQEARSWDRVAQPIQLSMMARGMRHEASHDLAGEMRSLGVELFNEHQMASVAKRMTDLLKHLFAEVPEVAEKLEEDAEALNEIAAGQARSRAEQARWEAEIAFEEQIGLVFKDTLKISAAGVEWAGRRYPLESITRVRWGGVRRSVNGIPTGTEFTIAFGDNQSEAVLKTNKQFLYSTFTEKLWKAACVRLMVTLLLGLRKGERYWLGNAVVDDRGVELLERHFLKSDRRVHCPWDRLDLSTANGALSMSLRGEKNTSAFASYIDHANTHIWEHILRLRHREQAPRLSDVLGGD